MSVTAHPAAVRRAEAPRLLEQTRQAIRVRHYSIRTEEAYLAWIRRFFAFTRRHHLHHTVVHRAIKQAVRHARVDKRVSCHTFRHSFATHVLALIGPFLCQNDSTAYRDSR